MRIDQAISYADLQAPAQRVLELAARKARAIDRSWDSAGGTPVFTVEGRYTTRGWTEWTQGFVYGLMLLGGEATGNAKLLARGRKLTDERMLAHVTHCGVHDHGFNNLSTYGNLVRLALEGTIEASAGDLRAWRDAIAASGAVQAMRWATTADEDPEDGGGYVYSFNGPHSLFVDTMRTLRILAAADKLGHVLMGEGDSKISLLGRVIKHALTTRRYILFDGTSGHTYDVRGRTAHEAIFNRNDGRFRCRSTQQGYSPFSTWTRGLAWAMLGFAEQLEYLATLENGQVKSACGLSKQRVMKLFREAAGDTCDHYIADVTACDGVTYWDDGAPGLAKLDGWQQRAADPFNEHEPVDASASAIAGQGLIRLGRHLGGRAGARYEAAGLTVARTLFDEPYLSTSARHQGLLLHSIYHQPNGWDHVPAGAKIPLGESSMWGDYHLAELALLVKRVAGAGDGAGDYPTFFTV